MAKFLCKDSKFPIGLANPWQEFHYGYEVHHWVSWESIWLWLVLGSGSNETTNWWTNDWILQCIGAVLGCAYISFVIFLSQKYLDLNLKIYNEIQTT